MGFEKLWDAIIKEQAKPGVNAAQKWSFYNVYCPQCKAEGEDAIKCEIANLPSHSLSIDDLAVNKYIKTYVNPYQDLKINAWKCTCNTCGYSRVVSI